MACAQITKFIMELLVTNLSSLGQISNYVLKNKNCFIDTMVVRIQYLTRTTSTLNFIKTFVNNDETRKDTGILDEHS